MYIYYLLNQNYMITWFYFRAISYARDFANKRKAFGKFIINHKLHCQTLGNMEVW